MGVAAAPAPEKGGARTSPVRRISRESIKLPVQLMLYAQSGGFCQFDACENSILEHNVTKTPENAGEKAHIVAYRDGGTRADPTLSTEYINSLENLMALCPGCHDHIDKNGTLYPRRRLEEMKHARVALVRDAIRNRSHEMKTHVLAFEVPIGGRAVSVATHETVSAIRPRYPVLSNPLRMDLNGLATLGETPEFYAVAAAQIEKEIGDHFRNGGALFDAHHISVFGLAPIPLLVKFGATLNDKIPIVVHHRRNNPATWDWNSEGTTKTDCYLYQNGGEKERLKTNLDTHIAHVRDSGILDAVCLLKLLRVRKNLSVKQFVWELLAIELLKDHKKKDLPTQLDHVLQSIADAKDAITIEDPANPTGNDLMPFLSSVWSELRNAANTVLDSVASDGWEAIFGTVDAAKAARVSRLTAAVQSVRTPIQPWDKGY